MSLLSANRYLEGQEDERSDVIHLNVNVDANANGEGGIRYFVSDEADLWIQVSHRPRVHFAPPSDPCDDNRVCRISMPVLQKNAGILRRRRLLPGVFLWTPR